MTDKNSAFAVRRAEISDADDIANAESRYIDCAWTKAQISDEIESPAALFYVAEVGGAFAGYISGTVAADECEVSNIAVSVEYRRCGVGRMLLDALKRGAKQSGCATMFLLVRSDNAPALALYGKSGFYTVGKRSGYYGGQDALIMRHNL